MKKQQFQQEMNSQALQEVNFFDAPIPGQSLTNSPDKPHAFERPPEFTSIDDLMLYFADILLEADTYTEMMKLLARGQTVDSLAQMILYTNFTEGKLTPDLMMLAYEPLVLFIMAMAERVNIDYEFDDDDVELEDLDAEETAKVGNVMQDITKMYKHSKQDADLEGMQKSAALKPELKKAVEEAPVEEVKSLLSR
jgi:hypothetical protein